MQSVKVIGTVSDPTPRSMLTLTYVPQKNVALMFGGQVAGPGETFVPTNDLYVLNFTSHNRWTALETTGDQPPARCGHASALLDNHFVVWGGRGQKSLSDTILYILDLSKREWKILPVAGAMPKPRFQHISCVIEDRLYMFGGHDGQKTCYRDLFSLRLNTSKNEAEWTEHFPTGDIPQFTGASAATVYNGRIVLVGGSNSQEYSNDVYIYDPKINHWSKMHSQGNVAKPRAALSAFVINDRVCVFGGSNGTYRFNDMFVVDLQENLLQATWARFPVIGPTPEGRSLHGAVVDGSNTVFLYGGWNGVSCFGDLYVMTTYGSTLSSSAASSGVVSMANLYQKSHLSDATLVCEGKEIPVHKSVLYCRSPLFQSWMEFWGAETQIKIDDMPLAALECLLEFAYKGTATIPAQVAVDVIYAADKYGLEGLKTLASREMIATLCATTVDGCYQIAQTLDLPLLAHACLLFATLNASAMMETSSVVQMVQAKRRAHALSAQSSPSVPLQAPVSVLQDIQVPPAKKQQVSPYTPLAAPPPASAFTNLGLSN